MRDAPIILRSIGTVMISFTLLRRHISGKLEIAFSFYIAVRYVVFIFVLGTIHDPSDRDPYGQP